MSIVEVNVEDVLYIVLSFISFIQNITQYLEQTNKY
jgi:hypothetical protein